MKTQSITLDATPFMFAHGGVGRVSLTLFQAMQKLQPAYQFKLYARRFKGAPLALPNNEVPIKQVRLPKRFEPLMARTGMIEALTRSDLYHATDHYMPLKHPEKAIVTLHDLLFITRPENGWGIHEYQRKHVPPFAQKCRRIITCSEYTRKDIVEHLQISPDIIDVIPWGIDRDSFRPPQSDDILHQKLKQDFGIQFPYFVAVGCSTGRKNTPRLLEAYTAMVGDSPKNHLVLVWDPPMEIRAKYNKEPWARFIHFTGRVSEPQLVQLYQGATASVYPSDYEGFGLPVLESFACGTPVITSDRSSLPEVGGNVAIYINPDDTDSIHAAMTRIENNDVNIAQLRQQGLDHCQKFRWENCAAQTLESYRKALEVT